MPRAPHIETNRFHILTGFTAVDEDSFQGLRERSNPITMEEAIGIDPSIRTACSIISGGSGADQRRSEPTEEDRQSHNPARENGTSYLFVPVNAPQSALWPDPDPQRPQRDGLRPSRADGLGHDVAGAPVPRFYTRQASTFPDKRAVAKSPISRSFHVVENKQDGKYGESFLFV